MLHRRTVWHIAATGVFFLIAACGGPTVSGRYVTARGNVSLDFRSGGEVVFHASETGFTRQDAYAINGGKVTIKSTGGPVGSFEIQSDRCLLSPTLGEMCKSKQ